MLSREKHYYLHEDGQKKLITLPYVVRHTPVLRCTLWRFLSLSFLFDPWKSLTRIPGALRISKIQSLGSQIVSLLNEIVWGCQEFTVFEVKIHACNLSFWEKSRAQNWPHSFGRKLATRGKYLVDRSKVWLQSSMVVISEDNTSTLVNGAPYLFVPRRPCKIWERI